MKKMRYTAVVLAAVLVSVSISSPPASAEAPGFEGDVPQSGGVGLVHWEGGSLDALHAAAGDVGCELVSTWTTVEGEFVGYVHGAQEFVNAEWTAEFGSDAEAGSLLLACTQPSDPPVDGLDTCAPVESFDLDYDDGTDHGHEDPQAALEALSDVSLPAGSFVAASTDDATETWQLVDQGVIIGEFRLVEGDDGWRVEGGEYCAEL